MYFSSQSFGIHSGNENGEDVVTKVEVRQSHEKFTQTLQCHFGKVLISKNIIKAQPVVNKMCVVIFPPPPVSFVDVVLVHCPTLREACFSPSASSSCCYLKLLVLPDQLREKKK